MSSAHVNSSHPEGFGPVWIPETDADRAAIREQVERLASNPLFNQSRRYSTLLRYIIEQTLNGHADQLKERTLGIEVFERDASYDTSADPVVRTTAAQLRRRIAEYYFQPDHVHEIVIELPRGGYVPEFRRPAISGTGAALQGESADHFVEGAGLPARAWGATESARNATARRLLVISAIVVLVLIGALGSFVRLQSQRTPSALHSFWGPVWASSQSVLLVVGGPPDERGSREPDSNASPTIMDSLAAYPLSWQEAMTLSTLVGLTKANGKTYHLRRARHTTYADLRSSPAILIGGCNNEWIMRLSAPLRFWYQADWNTGDAWIEDHQHPLQRNWTVNLYAPYSTFHQDYGVITRVVDPNSEHAVVMASAIASYGTVAAAELLTTEKCMSMVAERAPKGWEGKNLQVVFSSNVIKGNSGSPRILETYFW